MKLYELDNTEWNKQLFNNRNNINNGKKLRTYRLYKQHLQIEPYIISDIPRSHRRILTMFRSGSFPLAIETERYSRQPIPVNERTCKLCSTGDIENEIHFLMLCSLYSDLRCDLFAAASTKINYVKTTDFMSNFLNIMNCPSIQPSLVNSL